MRDLKKVFLTVGAVAAVGATASVGTFAGFNDTQTVGGNSFSSGKVDVQLEGSDTASNVLSLADMAIDDRTSGLLTVANVGRNKASYKISVVSPSGALVDDPTDADDYSDQLEIRISDDNGTASEEIIGWTPVSDLVGDAPVSLGDDLNKTATRDYTIAVRLVGTGSPAGDNALQDKTGTVAFKVDAIQRDGKARTDQGTPNADN